MFHAVEIVATSNKKLLGTKGIATRNKGITTRSKDATINSLFHNFYIGFFFESQGIFAIQAEAGIDRGSKKEEEAGIELAKLEKETATFSFGHSSCCSCHMQPYTSLDV